MSWEFTEKMENIQQMDIIWVMRFPLLTNFKTIQSRIAKLKEIGYQGDITIEREISGEEQKKDIRMAKELLDKLIAE